MSVVGFFDVGAKVTGAGTEKIVLKSCLALEDCAGPYVAVHNPCNPCRAVELDVTQMRDDEATNSRPRQGTGAVVNG